MKILIQEAERRPIVLRLPARLVLSRWLLRLIFRGRPMPPQTEELLRAVRGMCREFKGLKIVEIESAQGERVEITL